MVQEDVMSALVINNVIKPALIWPVYRDKIDIVTLTTPVNYRAAISSGLIQAASIMTSKQSLISFKLKMLGITMFNEQSGH